MSRSDLSFQIGIKNKSLISWTNETGKFIYLRFYLHCKIMLEVLHFMAEEFEYN